MTTRQDVARDFRQSHTMDLVGKFRQQALYMANELNQIVDKLDADGLNANISINAHALGELLRLEGQLYQSRTMTKFFEIEKGQAAP